MNIIQRIGFWAGLLSSAFTIMFIVFQSLQLFGLVVFPMDERAIYGWSLAIVIPMLFTMLAFHYTVRVSSRFWSAAALIFTILYAVFVTANYAVQLATVIPFTLKGKLDEVRMLQQTPHSMFWTFDGLGYIFLGLAAAVLVPAVTGETGFHKWLRRVLIAHACTTPLIAVVYFAPRYSYTLLLLAFPWAVTAPVFMMLLALNFKNTGNLNENQ
jgi:hypothetical protein